MKNYEGMKLPAAVDRTVRNELLKVDKYLRQSSVVLAKLARATNYPSVIVQSTVPGPGGAGNLPDHTHARTGQGGSVLGDVFSTMTAAGQWVFTVNGQPGIKFGNVDGATSVVEFHSGLARAIMSWRDNNNSLGPPLQTVDYIGCPGARFYPYKDGGGQFDTAYGQDVVDAWVMICNEGITYSFYTNNGAGQPSFLRCQWQGNGDFDNYGRVAIRKSSATGPSTIELRLERTGAGSQYMAFRANATIGTSHTYIFPGTLASGIWNVAASGATGTISMLTATRGAILRGNSTPAWGVLALGAADTFLRSDGTDLVQTEDLAKSGAAKVDLTGQTAAIGTTNLVASGHTAGVYRVSVVALCTTASGSGSPTLDVTIGWTDNVGAATALAVTGLSLSATAAGGKTGSVILRSTGAAAITYATTVNSASGSPQYALYTRVERLG